MEGCIEHKYLGQIGKHFLHCHVALEVGVRVQRSEFHVLFPLLEHFVGHNLALGEAAACHNAVTGSTDFVEAFDCAINGVEQCVEHELDALGVGGTRRLDDFCFAVDFGFEEGTFKTNLFDTASSEYRLVVHLVEFVFNR